jgi:hypothetical protein
MKKRLLILMLTAVYVVLFSTNIMSQELVIGGNMQKASDWIATSPMGGTDASTFTFNFSDMVPTAGDGPCLKISSFGQNRSLAYQAVEIVPGHSYSFGGAFYGASTDVIANSWVELLLSRKEPDPAADYGAGPGDYIFARNSWMTAPLNDMTVDGTFQNDFQFSWKRASGDSVFTTGNIHFTIPDTVSVTTWYVGIKSGIWSAAAGQIDPTYIYLFDNISLIDLGGVGINDNTANDLISLSNYPNPVTNNTLITYNVPENGNVQLAIYNILGEKVMTLVNETMVAGKYNYNLDVSGLSNNMYFYTLKVNDKTISNKLTVAK